MSDQGMAKVLGEVVMDWHQDGGLWFCSDLSRAGFACHSGPSSSITPVWNPLQWIDHAWMVVDRMKELGYDICLNSDEGSAKSGKWPDIWHANFIIRGDEDEHNKRYGPTEKVAICRAALTALRKPVYSFEGKTVSDMTGDEARSALGRLCAHTVQVRKSGIFPPFDGLFANFFERTP